MAENFIFPEQIYFNSHTGKSAEEMLGNEVVLEPSISSP